MSRLNLIALSILVVTYMLPKAMLREDIRDPSDCRLQNIRTHMDFKPGRFSGMWYLISDYDTQGQLLYMFLDIADVRANFSVMEDGRSMNIMTGKHI